MLNNCTSSHKVVENDNNCCLIFSFDAINGSTAGGVIVIKIRKEKKHCVLDKVWTSNPIFFHYHNTKQKASLSAADIDVYDELIAFIPGLIRHAFRLCCGNDPGIVSYQLEKQTVLMRDWCDQ